MEINRGYYAVARRYELHVQVSLEHKIHILELTCNVLFYYIDILMTAFLTIFRRFLKIFQNCSKGQTNVPEHFPKILEDSRRLQRLSSYNLRDKLDISEIINIFTSESMKNTPLESRM